MRSISSKLILAFLSIGVVSVLIIAATAVWSTRAEFIRFLSDQTQLGYRESALDYHRTYGSWERADPFLDTATACNRAWDRAHTGAG